MDYLFYISHIYAITEHTFWLIYLTLTWHWHKHMTLNIYKCAKITVITFINSYAKMNFRLHFLEYISASKLCLDCWSIIHSYWSIFICRSFYLFPWHHMCQEHESRTFSKNLFDCIRSSIFLERSTTTDCNESLIADCKILLKYYCPGGDITLTFNHFTYPLHWWNSFCHHCFVFDPNYTLINITIHIWSIKCPSYMVQFYVLKWFLYILTTYM